MEESGDTIIGPCIINILNGLLQTIKRTFQHIQAGEGASWPISTNFRSSLPPTSSSITFQWI